MISLIAVDWGTSNFRAFALDASGEVIEHVAAHDGMSTIPAGGFAVVLDKHAGAWMKASPAAPVIMAGMVGSRNGWIEAPYTPCPASPRSVSASMARVTDRVSVVPGVVVRRGSDADVMRGEETLIFGTGVLDGLVCLPGTHSKWAVIEGGSILDFSTFMTGESYALYRNTSLLGRLASEPPDDSAFALGLEAAHDKAGLLNRLFQARARVLDGKMRGDQVGPYLSGLLIGEELEGAFARYGTPKHVTVVADGVLAKNYGAALTANGVEVVTITPEAAFLAGLRAIAGASVT